MKKNLSKIRKDLDRIDNSILDALSNRQKIIEKVARLKSEDRRELRDIFREQSLLTRLVDSAREKGLDVYYVTQLFREILEYSVRYQQEYLADRQNPQRLSSDTVTVAYQGAEGSYSHISAMKHFSPRDIQVVYKGFNSFQEMLEAVKSGRMQYGLLPIENTTAGSINEAYDLLARMNLYVVGEEILQVKHCLVALENVHINHVRRIYSHPQALAQCSNFLSSLHHCTIESFTDTAMAVEKIRAEKEITQAAIASEEAANLYGLTVIKRGIANQIDNYTRFVLVAREALQYDLRIPCKTSLIFATRHEEGALLKCLNVLSSRGLNLTKLESRPRPNVPWEYLFYLDFEGNTADPKVDNALQEVVTHTSFMKVLGSYPARTTEDSKPVQPLRTSQSSPIRNRYPKTNQNTHRKVIPSIKNKPYKLVSRAHRKEDTCISVGDLVIGDRRKIVIGGPSAVESRTQILECARVAKNIGADVLYGGCFRPGTVPETFEGLGVEGLELLEEAGRLMGLPIITEVIDPSDVTKIAKHSDMIKIGARNMLNTALLKEVGQVDRPVILRRGLMASIDEWLAAAERILSAGNQQVILCEGGIRTFETATPNTLDLSAVPIVKELSHLPIIVDPSRACGHWQWIPKLAEASLASGAHGIMIEFHPEPAKAMVDGEQALSIENFQVLMQQLTSYFES